MLDNNSAMDHTGRNRPLVALIAHSNLHCKEIDDYVKEFKPKYQRKLRELAASSREWASASAIDREDLMIEYRQQAIASLDVQPYCDSENLFEGEPADITLDDALIDRFGFDTMSFYLGRATNLDKIHRVPADHYDRAGFEKLVDLGLAVRGTAIPLPTILMKLTLKEMRELVSDLAAPSFRKKAQAIDFILALPDTQDRVGRAIPFRALFKLNALPPQFSGVDLTQVASSWSYAAEIAFILAHTYRFVHYQANTSESDNQLNHLDSFMKGWKILATTNSCPCCLRAAKKRFPRT